MSAFSMADQMYKGTWNVTGQDAGTITLRVSDTTISGYVVNGKDSKRTGHLSGTYTGKRFVATIRLTDGTVREFQGNFTHSDTEAHMDGLLYHGDKPDTEVKFTVDVMSMSKEPRFFAKF